LREDGSRAALTHQPIFSFHDHVKNVVKINAEPGSGRVASDVIATAGQVDFNRGFGTLVGD
jgi:hypothetical protein